VIVVQYHLIGIPVAKMYFTCLLFYI